MAQYVTAVEAQRLREQGLGNQVQAGNYLQTRLYDALSRLVWRADKFDKVGQCIHPTNPQKSVGKRSHELYVAKRTHKIILEEPVSAHLVKNLMSRRRKVRKIAELEHLAEKIDASKKILEESLELI